MRTLSAIGVGLALASGGCSDPLSTDAGMVPAVMVGDVLYTATGPLDLQISSAGSKYTEVTRMVDCSEGIWLHDNTHVSDYCPLEEGESNYLPAGTPMHRVEGVDPAEALTVFHGDQWGRLESGPGTAGGQ